MAGKNDGAFTPEERRAALWALLIAALIAIAGAGFQHWSGPSLGPWSADQASLTTTDVLDARPTVS